MGERINSVVVGCNGEVGKALATIVSQKFEMFGIDKDTPISDYPFGCMNLHITIPYSNNFVEIVNEYVHRLNPDVTIIHSSVPIGTTKKIFWRVVHSPVRGRHPNLEGGLRKYVKYVGYNDDYAYKYAKEHLEKLFVCEFIHNTDYTEALKIFSLCKYLVYLAVADEISEACKVLGMDYERVKHWERTQNEYVNEFYPSMSWPVLDPPEGKIGGHCIMPVSEMMVNNDNGLSAEIISKARFKYEVL